MQYGPGVQRFHDQERGGREGKRGTDRDDEPDGAVAGRQAESFESDIILHGLPGPGYRAVFIRAPWVEETGSDVEVLATEPHTGRIVAVRQGPALATAFHPELTPDWRIHELFVDMVRERS